MMWPGSEFAYQGKYCTFSSPLDKTESLEERFDKAMMWFKNGANLVMLYSDQPDEYGHAYSPNSKQVI